MAIAISFFVIVLSLAISAGFRYEIRKGISEVSGDVRLVGSSEPIDIQPSYYQALEAVDGVQSISPAIWKPGIIKGETDICGVLVKGVSMPDSCSLKAQIPNSLSRRLGIREGDTFTTYFIEDKVRARRFTVDGTYEGIMDSEGAYIVKVPLTDMQRLCGYDSLKASVLEVKIDPARSTAWGSRIIADQLYLASLSGHQEDEDILHGETARARYPQLFDWLDLIDFNVLAIILLMTVVAGFNMISGLLILLFRNIATIGTLKSLGMKNKSIAAVFLRVASRIVLIGMAIGNGAALLFCALQGGTHLIKLNPVNYFVSFVPVHIDIALILTVDAVAFGVILLFMLIPSLFIAKVDPAVTVRVK